MRLLAVFALGVCATASAQVTVDEQATRAESVNGATTVSLALRSSLDRSVKASVLLDWVDPNGTRHAHAAITCHVSPGDSKAAVALPLSSAEDALFYRLRYTVMPDLSNLRAFDRQEGVVALPQVASFAFRLRAVGIGEPRLGQPYEFRVFAEHPVTHAPIAGVELVADDDRKSSAKTDAKGEAVLRLTPDPEDWDQPDDVTIKGRLGDFAQSVDTRRPALPPSRIQIYTDKPLYQPGQTLHARILAIGSNGKARAGAAYAIRIRDERETLTHAAELKTSRFGIASTDWEIPVNATPGTYEIEVSRPDGDERSDKQVEVRRYELPTLRVTAQADRGFYLPGQNASVEIRGEYLFGKAVANGKVRISERDGNETLCEGELDSSGKFLAAIDLKEAHADLAKEYFGARFSDYHYTAYVTDPLTNHTEQGRFDLRVSRQPIHIYLVRSEESSLAGSIYISTYTPDGKPLRAQVTALVAGHKAGVGTTNELGLARLDLEPGEGPLVVEASANGLTASQDLGATGSAYARVVLETDRALYRAGEGVRCRIRSDRKDLSGRVLAWGEGAQLVYSSPVRLAGGATDFVIPYDRRFGRALSIGFFALSGAKWQASRQVLYPATAAFDVAIRPAKREYRPGDKASVTFQAKRDSSPVEAALGIAVVDESVFERASADATGSRLRWFQDPSERERKVAGFSFDDLLQLNPARIDNSLQLVAAALLDPAPLWADDSSFEEDQRTPFEKAARANLSSLQSALDNRYHGSLEYPRDEDALRAQYPFDQARDPWMEPYRAEFSIEGPNRVLRFISAGPDKQFGTDDDFEALKIERDWFLPVSALIQQALRGLPDYPASESEFVRLLSDAGIRFDALRDPWGHSLRVEIRHAGDARVIAIRSAGPDGTRATADDFDVATYRGTYFGALSKKIGALLEHAATFPSNTAQLKAILTAGGIDMDREMDPWGRPYQFAFREGSSFADSVEFYTYQDFGGVPQQREQITPVKHRVLVLELRRAGTEGASQGFTVAQFTHLVTDGRLAAVPPAPAGHAESAGGRGATAGVIRDQTGAAIPYASVVLEKVSNTMSGPTGQYAIRGVLPGVYELRAYCAGFQVAVVGGVPVVADRVTRLDVVLRVGTAAETVTVTADPGVSVDTFSAEISAQRQVSATSTPRVRDYFPETLVWNPELITDSAGRAHLDFQMADSMTTWRVAVVGSTEDGRITESSAEIRAFQPFFVDLDPPQILTAGDEIELPVPVRNYLAVEQSVSMEASAPAGLAVANPKQTSRIAPSAAGNAVLRLRPAAPVADARLRVTARANNASDRVEKPLTINPYGEPVSISVSDLVSVGRVLHLDVPAGVIPETIRGEVRLYPSLLAGVLESIKGLLHKPAGCGEQTISTSYLNLLAWRALKGSGIPDAATEQRVRLNLESGYNRLLGFRADDGGFGYWSNAQANLAITAYAISFLEDASGVIEVDDDVLEAARSWLTRQKPEDAPSLRSVATRALAKAGPKFEEELLQRLNGLARDAAKIDDPYTIATFALAAMDAQRPELARESIERLKSLARDEQGALYWHLQSNTPYYGWGRAGRVETTALAVSALAHWRKAINGDAQLNELIDRGALFLIRNKDAWGMWYSTQATVRALAALTDAIAPSESSRPLSGWILVNGARAGQIQLTHTAGLGPVTIDVSAYLKPGVTNEISVQGAEGTATAELQLSANWYQAWQGPRSSNDLAMQVRYSAAETTANEPVRCDVTISRPNFRGYGMMIAEIGLPPGAEVDRGSLARLLEDRSTGVDSFDVAPDHVTLYVWPRASDSKFTFLFRPRFPMRVRMAPSVLYDYYNPDARVVLPPESLVVR